MDAHMEDVDGEEQLHLHVDRQVYMFGLRLEQLQDVGRPFVHVSVEHLARTITLRSTPSLTSGQSKEEIRAEVQTVSSQGGDCITYKSRKSKVDARLK